MKRIAFSNGKVFECPDEYILGRRYADREREWRQISVFGTYDEVKGYFVNGAEYRKEWDSEFTNEDGETSIEVYYNDLTEYSIAGNILDSRDGVITVYMGKMNEKEQLEMELARAKEIIAQMQEGAEQK